MNSYQRVRMQPYQRVHQFKQKLMELSNGQPGHNGFHPNYSIRPKFLKYWLRDKEKRSDNQKYKPGRDILAKSALTSGQKERFCKLLGKAYGLQGEYLEQKYWEISLFMKKKFAENERAFFTGVFPDGQGGLRRGLFMRHTNPNGRRGGVCEATVHIHCDEANFIIMHGCTIAGSAALSGTIKLYHESVISGRGVYHDCVLVRGTKLYDCEATSSFFADSYGSKSTFGEPGRKTVILESSFKNCGKVVGRHMNRVLEGGRYVCSRREQKEMLKKKAELAVPPPVEVQKTSEGELHAAVPALEEAAGKKLGLRGWLYAASYSAGWLFAAAKDGLGLGKTKGK